MSSIRRLPPLFWIGLLPVVVLLWAWADSVRHEFYWYFGTWELQHRIYVDDSALTVFRITGVEKISAMTETNAAEMRSQLDCNFGPVRRRDAASLPTATWFPAPAAPAEEVQEVPSFGVEYRVRQWLAPFWLILLGYLPLWLGISWWQARRRRKKIERELAAVKDGA